MSIEKLLELEASGKHVFHGSPKGDLEKLEPQQGTHVPDISKPEEVILDGEPAVSATPYAELAAYRAIVNTTNIPFDHRSGFGMRDKEKVFRISSAEALAEALNNKKGYVYVFDKNDFEPYNRKREALPTSMEWRSYKEVAPLEVVEVSSKDLPPVDKIKVG
jgi:hypothetical protein